MITMILKSKCTAMPSPFSMPSPFAMPSLLIPNMMRIIMRLSQISHLKYNKKYYCNIQLIV